VGSRTISAYFDNGTILVRARRDGKNMGVERAPHPARGDASSIDGTGIA
jgi:hypothetical protein